MDVTVKHIITILIVCLGITGVRPALALSYEWMDRWNVQDEETFGFENLEVLEEERQPGNRYLRVTYPSGSWSPSATEAAGLAIGGAQFLSQPEVDFLPADEIRLAYQVKFDENFDFVKGGKLPGIYGGEANSGGDIPDGTDGFSVRLMWREGGAGEVYAYLPTSSGYGTSLGRGSWYFEPGQWYELELTVRLNTVGSVDGSITLRVDGQTVVQEDQLLFRTVDTLMIDGIFFSTFFGGSDASWATPKTTYTYFDNFRLRAP